MSKLVTSDNLKAYHAELAEHIKLLQRNTTYALNDIVNYDGITLKCTTAGTTNTTKPNISSLAVGSTYTDGTCVWTRVDLDKRGIDYYESAKDYVVDDQVVYDNKIYKCITAHTSTSTFDTTKWAEISAGGGGGIATYTNGTSYSSGDLVIKDQVLYQANTTTSTTWVDSEWDIIGTTFNSTSTYAQKVVTNVVAPYEMLLQVGDSNYCKPPIDVLKKTGGSDNVTLTLETYNNTSAYTGTSDFLKIENSKAKLYNYKEYPITTQTLSIIDIGVSDEIDFDEFYGGDGTPDSNTLALLHFDEDYSDIFSDDWVIYGTGISIDNSDSKFGDGSLRISNNSYLASTQNERFNFLSNDFTIDLWFKLDNPSSGNQTVFASNSDFKIGVFCGSDAYLNWFLSSNGSSWNLIVGDVGSRNGHGTITVTSGWHHLAYVRNGTTIYGFLDGQIDIQINGITDPVVDRLEPMRLGYWGANTYGMTGNIDELRISNVARWTSDFTPPTQPYPRPNYNISSLEVN